MNNLKVGFATVNIDPPLGAPVAGYYIPRFVKGFIDNLETSAMALSCGDKTVVMISVDVCMIKRETVDIMMSKISERTGVSAENIFLSATHTHTGPVIEDDGICEIGDFDVDTYLNFLVNRIADCVALSLDNMLPAKMGYATVKAPDRIAYIRRYRMKDGSTCTCPPINDPNIAGPIGELDQRVHILRFDREGGESIVLLNYGLHADTVNGEYISADWPGELRKTVAKVFDGTKCIVFCGAQGDVGSTNVHPVPGDMNDTEISFDNEMKSPGMARFVGRALAGAVLQVYDKVAYTDVENIEVTHKILPVPTNMPSFEDLPRAHEYKKLHDMGRDDLIPYSAMELTTVVAEALRMCELENGPTTVDFDLLGIKIGNVALIGIPGEPFTEVGVEIKKEKGFDVIMPCALTNGYYGYFPTMSAYNEGGYEARTAKYKAGVAELIVDCAKEILEELKNE